MVNSTPQPQFTPGKDPLPIVQEAGWAPGPVLTGGKSRSHWESIPHRPARTQSLYRLSYPAHIYIYICIYIYIYIILLLRRIASGGPKSLRAFPCHPTKRDIKYRDIILSDNSLVTAAGCLKLQNFDVTLEKCDAFAGQRENNRHGCKPKKIRICGIYYIGHTFYST